MTHLQRKLLKRARQVASHIHTAIIHDKRDNSDELRIEMEFEGVTHVQRVREDSENPSGLLWDMAALVACIEEIDENEETEE